MTASSTLPGAAPAQARLQARNLDPINWVGVATLYMKEVRRFLKVFLQTIVAPAATTLLFIAIFSLALGGENRHVGNVPFLAFLAPGLIMMAIIQNSFANTSSSIMISKIQGNILDLLMPPLSAGEVTFAVAMGGLTRGVLVAITLILALSPFAPVSVVHWWAVLYFTASSALLLALLGIIAGIWADKFDHLATVTNFVIMPLSFLSGAFYSIDRLPGVWNTVSHFNPFFYLIDGFRYGFIGQSDGALVTGVIVAAASNAVLWVACHAMFRSGYKLKA